MLHCCRNFSQVWVDATLEVGGNWTSSGALMTTRDQYYKTAFAGNWYR